MSFETKFKEFTRLENQYGEKPIRGHFLSEYIIENLTPSCIPVIMTVIGPSPQDISVVSNIYNATDLYVKKSKLTPPPPPNHIGPWPPICPVNRWWTKAGLQFPILNDLKDFEILEMEISSDRTNEVYFKFNGMIESDDKTHYKIIVIEKANNNTIPNNTNIHIYIKLKDKRITT